MRRFRPFNRLEDTLERAIEGSVDRVFRPSIQPSEIARKLSREMSERQLASMRGALVPNVFLVRLHPDDLASFAGNDAAIAAHLELWMDDEADRLGFVTMGQMNVLIEPDGSLRRRSIAITSSMKEKSAASSQPVPALGQTEAFWVQPQQQPLLPSYMIEVIAGPLNGLAHFIHKAETSIGRSLDNDWVIDGPNISRHHAVIEMNGSQLRVADLSSTNGTFVNGRQVVSWTPIYPGDVITFGVVETRVVHDHR